MCHIGMGGVQRALCRFSLSTSSMGSRSALSRVFSTLAACHVSSRQAIAASFQKPAATAMASSAQTSLRQHGTAASSGEDHAVEDEVLHRDHQDSGLRIALLNRPKALNALTTNMVIRLRELYEEWETNPKVRMVLIKGRGRVFCAGGDVRAVRNLGEEGNLEAAKAFFREEYKMNYVLATLQKPHVAFLNGVVMGGGNGISMLGQFRVVTENAVFAMPETAIGLHPDVGASYFLSRLPGYFGEYLGLTGARLDGADMFHVGLATHTVPAANLDALEDHLGELGTSDSEAINRAIWEYSERPDVSPNSPLHKQDIIDECFALDSVEAIVAALNMKAEEGDEWCKDTLKLLAKGSPTSQKVTLRSIREGRRTAIRSCLLREYRISSRCLESPDFYEGVRAVLVDKDNSPEWRPNSLQEVSPSWVQRFFEALPHSEELSLPSIDRERLQNSRL